MSRCDIVATAFVGQISNSSKSRYTLLYPVFLVGEIQMTKQRSSSWPTNQLTIPIFQEKEVGGRDAIQGETHVWRDAIEGYLLRADLNFG